jgi:hypothetical protein
VNAVLNSTGLVSAIIGLTVILTVALWRDRLGKPKADKMSQQVANAAHVAGLFFEAATYAVTEVERELKGAEEMDADALKSAAIGVAAEILEKWGVNVSKDMMLTLAATVESAYQQLKAAKEAGYKILPVEAK